MTYDLLKLNDTTDDQLVIIREFAVPRHLVFEALTEHKHIMKWASPKKFDVTFSESDFKVGGEYRYGMQSGEGPEIVMTGEYKEITQPDKLVYTQSREIPDGSSGPDTTITIELEEKGGKTAMLFRHSGFPSREFRNGSIHGWNEAFEKLESHLNSLM
ncbi:MAG: SRPBCC family protein [Candidatus Thorarchaeota archaeon]|jgi:uncharacterized protein YndB with AHSA1/START domain